MDIDDEKVSQFMAVTGSMDPERATSYLEMSGGNLETAVSLFMEHEQGGGASGGAAAAQEIRAPDQVRTERLMDDNPMMMMHQDPTFRLMNAMMEEQLAQSAFADSSSSLRDVRAAVNAAAEMADYEGSDDGMNADENDEGDDNGSAAAPVVAPARLSNLFSPPTHLIHSAGGFQGARAMAKDTKRWLLVNIQRDEEFSSHALNRDVWRDELVENLIREGFIFWQQMNIHPDGRTYSERYQVHSFPHVGIIDPRTGRLMWRKEGWTQEEPLTAVSFAEMAMDFCSRNSFDRPPQAPRSGGSSGRPTKRPMHEMSEDEQLQAAMRASMEDTKASEEPDVEYIADSDDEEEEDGKQSAEEAPAKSANDELVAMSIGDEPAAGARIQFRMPDGKRVVRKFATSDTVKTIFAFVAQTNNDARGGKEFILMAGFPPSDLLPRIDDTIGDCQLSGQAITMRWKE